MTDPGSQYEREKQYDGNYRNNRVRRGRYVDTAVRLMLAIDLCLLSRVSLERTQTRSRY